VGLFPHFQSLKWRVILNFKAEYVLMSFIIISLQQVDVVKMFRLKFIRCSVIEQVRKTQKYLSRSGIRKYDKSAENTAEATNHFQERRLTKRLMKFDMMKTVNVRRKKLT
jgi:hypothetical protein